MRLSMTVALAFVTGVAVCDASAQSAAPSVELGLDVSALLVADPNGLHGGPRLVAHFNGRDALQFTASLQKLSPWDDARKKTDLYLAAYRRLVHAAGPVRVSATLGGGLERTVIVTPPVTFGNPPITFPSTRGAEVLPVFTTGAAIDVRVGSRAAIVLESSFILTDRLGGRLSTGLVVPVGSYPPRDRLASSVPWAELDAGERAWVTTADGREADGEVVSRSAATLTLRTRTGIVSFTADDLRAIDTTDPIRNGTVLGAKIGGLGAIAPSVLITGLFCTLEDGCSVGEVLWVNAFLIGMGTGVGAATGALADSLRERRVPLYRRRGSTRVMLAPIVGGHRLGGGAVIRW
ncbi:MAG TPA: hypothetical protein VK886_14260 [Vicinamibacterales bacterium]|nr:hypothetical protein [Vicinamibacterales bacterium]